ncbi:hypothetical protein MTY66_19830 [Mycolicibacterium sp. TY66]|nr:hypothetical protein MTY66_19830 [Mycolicibacterium sp. TY66]
MGETKRRTKVIGRFPGETSAVSLVWAVLDRASAGWRGLSMTPVGTRLLHDLRRSLLDPPRELRLTPSTTSNGTNPRRSHLGHRVTTPCRFGRLSFGDGWR